MDFKIFLDKELTKPVNDPIDLGKLKAGETKQFTYYVFNSGIHPYEEVKFSLDNREVKVISPIGKVNINEKSSTKIILQWNPSVDIKKGLHTNLKIEGYQVVG